MSEMRERVKENLIRFSAYGKNPERGISRVFGSDALKEASEAVCRYFESCGMKSYIDPVGNVHGIYRPSETTEKEILLGSHLDTVQEGGIFDGLLGVVAAAETVRRIREEKQVLPYGLHVIATNGEEGNDLGGTFGSRCLAGLVDTEDAAFQKKMEAFGYTVQEVKDAKLDFSKICCYLELHIEQGQTLDREQEDIGIVTGIVGLRRYEIGVYGEANHSGTTMMEYRKDALVAASEMILWGNQLAMEMGRQLVATFNKVRIHPNVDAVISDEVHMTMEVRNLDEAWIDAYAACMQKKISAYEHADMKEFIRKMPVCCKAEIMHAVQKSCEKLKLRYRKMSSGATHDGNAIGTKVPIGMIFAPSRDGISHSPDEWTEWEACGNGAEVLYHTVLNLKEEAL